MPKQSIQRKYKIRLTLSPMDDEKVIKFFSDLKPDRLAIGRDDDASRPHYHIALEHKISTNTLKMYLKTAFDLHGNEDYQCIEQQWDNKYIGYCIKNKRLCLVNVLEGDIIPWLSDDEYKPKKKQSVPNRELFLKYVQSLEDPIACPKWLNWRYLEFSRGYYKEYEAVACIRFAMWNLGAKISVDNQTWELIKNKFPGYSI